MRGAPSEAARPPGSGGGARLVALTGASGFIGQHLTRELLDAGFRVRALARRASGTLEEAGAEVVSGSLEDAGAIAALVAGSDAVVHAAGITQASRDGEFHTVNARATATLAKAAAAAGSSRFVLVSSLAARHPELSPYARSKRDAEEAIAAQPGLDWTVVRPPAVYGPGDKATLEIFRLMNRGVLPIPWDPRARASLIYVVDLCRAIVALTAGPTPVRTILEVRDSCAEGYSWRQIAAVGAAALNRPVTCIPIPPALLWLAGHIGVVKCQLTGKAARISPGKARELCHIDWVCGGNPIADLADWTPRVGIEEGFRRTVGWYREHNWL